jgi:hypothetical protein
MTPVVSHLPGGAIRVVLSCDVCGTRGTVYVAANTPGADAVLGAEGGFTSTCAACHRKAVDGSNVDIKFPRGEYRLGEGEGDLEASQ